jgi:hypothetical protein
MRKAFSVRLWNRRRRCLGNPKASLCLIYLLPRERYDVMMRKLNPRAGTECRGRT